MSRRKRKKHEEHTNLERWLVSYADFITLLFAFFVVMYSISSVNDGKYRVLSDSLQQVFDSQGSSLNVIEFENPLTTPTKPETEPQLIELPIPEESPPLPEERNPTLEEIAENVTNEVDELIKKGLVAINQNENWLEIEIKSSILFQSGGATLSEDAEDVLASLAKIIKGYKNFVQVEGFTDNQPINTARFPSNWELSSARAASVVHLFEDEGVNPEKMQAIGYGEYRPKADNKTEAGRNANRRVNLVVLGANNSRKVIKTTPDKAKSIPKFEDEPEQFDSESKSLIDF